MKKIKKNGTFSSNIGYISLPVSIKKRIKYYSTKFSKQEITYALHLLQEIDQRKNPKIIDDEIELIQFISKTIDKK